MKTDGIGSLSLAAAWTGLWTPVLALAGDLALRRAAAARPPLSLRIRASGIDALRRERDAATPTLLLTVAGRPQQALHHLPGQLAGALTPEVALAFAHDQSVSQQIVLPKQPEDVLRAIVRNKVESLAPWPLAQCLWGMRVSPIAGDPGHVAADIAVVSRALLDDIASVLEASGSEVTAATVMLADGEEVDIDLGGDDIRRAAEARAVTLARAAGVLLVLLAGLGLFGVYRTAAETARLERETAAALASLKPSGALAGEPPLVAAANRLHALRADRLPAVAILDELSRLLPDNVYLTYLGLNDAEVVLKGQGSGVPDLVSPLESSPLFGAVNFAAATELDENSKADSFSLSAQLEKAP